MAMSKKEEYDRLVGLINQWNVEHYDIFELSQPNEDLEFHGVMRFFFQGGIGASVTTKCIRVSSTATTREIIDVLIEKFRPDMRMLAQSKYALYEVHVNGEERRLTEDEKPLLVQLNWGKDVREGRFLLRNEDHPTVRDPALGFDKSVLQQDQAGLKRKLSRRERKERRKREKDRGKENINGDDSVANNLYEAAPETSFTRSISNPEAVMRRRRQQKLERKLAQMNTGDGGTDSGGTLKIYGESLCPDVPYKTLFLSTADPASAVVKEAMEKYGLEKEDPSSYCLVEVLLPPGGVEYHGQKAGDERVLDENECPLAIVIQHAKHRGHIIFQLRKRSADYKKRQKQRSLSQEDLRNHQGDHRHTNVDMLPYLVELNVRGKPRRHVLPLNVTEVVNVTEVADNKPDYAGKHFLQLSGPDIHPRHCVIAHTQGIVTLTPNSRNAETYVEGQRISETTMLKHGMTIQFGKDRLYRFLDPRFDEPVKQNQAYQLQRGQPPDSKFDMDGTAGGSSPRLELQSWEAQQRNASHRSPSSPRGPHDRDDLLPASIEYFLDAQHILLQALTLDVNSKQLQFKLAPTYSLYMAVRHLLSAGSPVTHRGELVADFVMKTAKLTQQSIQGLHNDPSSLAFWMANSSEILHMFKQDRDISHLSVRSQEMLAEAVQTAFHHLVRCLQGDLQRVMPAFLDPSDNSERDDEIGRQYNVGRPTLADILDTLSAAMTLLRRCRVNAALTIQLFSQLFHFINMWLFNILVTEPQLQLCTRVWGIRLKRRLGSVEAWAEKQGLELAADCHLCRIIQAAHLLEAPKATSDDITNISSTCFKLNSLQLRCLLTQYIPEPDEPPVSMPFVERVVSIAENMADELTRTDGREVMLEEDGDLHLPFLLPEDGYSCETIRGIPNGLSEFVRLLETAGICRFIINVNASGSWTVYMEDEPLLDGKTASPGSGLPPTPEVITIAFNKVKGSMGLSIVAAIGEGQFEQGIYIKSVVEGGAAAMDGRLQAGDQLLEVDGKSLIGLTQDKAAELMTRTGQVVKLKVAKRAVLYHNLGSLLSQPSPTSQRAALNREVGPTRPSTVEGSPSGYDGRDSKLVNGYGDPNRVRAPSTSNLADPRIMAQSQPYGNHREDPRSKSTSNLHVDTSLDRGTMQQQLKMAQSVGMLHHSSTGYSQYPPGGHLQDVRPNDYENQPRYQPANGDRSFTDGQVRPGNNSVGPYQNLHQGRPLNQYSSQGLHHPGMPQRTSDRSSLSSRTSSVSNRDMRVASAYYDPHNISRGSHTIPSRPRSEDVGSKLKEWQNKYDDPRGGYKQTNGGNSPPYSNIGAQNRNPPPQLIHSPQPKPTYNSQPKPSAQDRLFTQPSMPQKHDSNAYNRQPNLYENTSPLQHEPPSAFHQVQQPHTDSDGKPKVVTSAFLPHKNQPHIQHPDMHLMRVDNRQTQPNFIDTQSSSSSQSGQPNNLHVAGYQQRGVLQHDQRSMLQQVPRNLSQPDFHNDTRLTQDFRDSSNPRNGPVQDHRGLQQDPQNIHDPRNAQYSNTRTVYPQQIDLPNMANILPNSNYQENRSFPPNANFQQQQQQRFADTNNHFGYPTDSQDFPSPSVHNGVPHGHPNISFVNNYGEDLPPLPPPPSQDALIGQKAAEDLKMSQPVDATNQFMVTDPKWDHKYSSNALQQQPQPTSQVQQYQPQQRPQQPSQLHQQPSSMNHVMPPRVDARNVTPAGYRPPQDVYRQDESQSNYQNISFASEVRAASGPAAQTPSGPQPLSSSFENPKLKVPGLQVKPAAASTKSKLRERSEINSRSAWDRDAKEKAEEEEQEELFKAREQEIADLESRTFLSPQDQERLRKLKTEHEFQRRVREIAEKGDYEYEDDEEFAERYYNRERLIQMLKDDLEKSQQRMREYELSHQRADLNRESDRLQTLQRRLEMYEKDKEEHKLRMQKKQERRAKEHQDQIRLQRETREKQRQNFEEHKRQMIKEEEKLNQKREEELNKRRQFERERRQQLQDKRDENERRIREEMRREDQELLTQQLAKERQQRLDQNRTIHVGDEKQRLESISKIQGQPGVLRDPGTSGFSQYANVASSSSLESPGLAPQPPERKSSYETVSQHQQRHSFRGSSSAEFPAGTSGGLPSALRNSQEPPAAAKKSVSFNTEMNTYKDRTPNHSGSSYKSVASSQASDKDIPPPNFNNNVDAFESVPPAHNTNISNEVSRQPSSVYTAPGSTPSVIGAQEVYRDPRSRIEAKIASQSSTRSSSTDRMSFRDKMKYFAKEAGEDTIKYKPKSSKTLREIESQLNGQ